MRIAAVGDLHVRADAPPALRRGLVELCRGVDVLLLAGDLTDHGRPEEARVLAAALAELPVPILAVLGNHDYESGAADVVVRILEDVGVRVLDGDACVIDGVGFAGAKGFGGGFGAHALGAWGERAIKDFAGEARHEAAKLRAALAELDTPQRVVLLHYAPVRATLEGEAPEIYPFLGSSHLADALEAGGATLVFHGHAHAGAQEGATRSGIPVCNVAAPLLGPVDASRIPARVVEIDPSSARGNDVFHGPGAIAECRLGFYRGVLRILREARIPHMVGGGVALERLTGVPRNFHDLDLVLRPDDVERALRAFSEQGVDAELAAAHWLAKVYGPNGLFIDLIFNSGNGACPVDDLWLEHAVPGELLDEPVLFCPIEELLWMKSFVMERERYDGADVIHLLHACAGEIDWHRLSWRFGPHWRVLLSHLILFGFVFPGERSRLPQGLLSLLIERLRRELDEDDPRTSLCRGGLLSRAQYIPEFERGYQDARELPLGALDREEIDAWTRAIGSEGEAPPEV